jgi:outer membrane protein TolC
LLSDEKRAQRLLDLTGLTPEQLRGRIETRALQLSVLDFLMAHEPDLLAAAEALAVEPAAIGMARAELAR